MRDADILTVDRYTFVGDERFEAHYSATQETWNLVIKYVQERDAGVYECQVSTEPKMSQFFNLRVVGKCGFYHRGRQDEVAKLELIL